MTAAFRVRGFAAPAIRTRTIRPHVPWYKDVHDIADRLAPQFAADITQALKSATATRPSDWWLAAASRAPLSLVSDLTMIGQALRVQLELRVRSMYTRALAEAGQLTLDSVQDIKAGHRKAAEGDTPDVALAPGVFDRINAEAVAFVESQSGTLITSLTEDALASVRRILARSFEGEWDVRTTARLLPEVVGLNATQSASLARYVDGLRGMDPPFDPAYVEKQAAARAAQMAKQRALTIARTETIRGTNEGVRQGWGQAVSQRLIEHTAGREWIITPDESVCPMCEELDGQVVGLEDSWDDVDAPPAHPNCRCAMGLVPDWDGG